MEDNGSISKSKPTTWSPSLVSLITEDEINNPSRSMQLGYQLGMFHAAAEERDEVLDAEFMPTDQTVSSSAETNEVISNDAVEVSDIEKSVPETNRIEIQTSKPKKTRIAGLKQKLNINKRFSLFSNLNSEDKNFEHIIIT